MIPLSQIETGDANECNLWEEKVKNKNKYKGHFSFHFHIAYHLKEHRKGFKMISNQCDKDCKSYRLRSNSRVETHSTLITGC